MHPLTSTDYDRIRSLFQPLDFHDSIGAMLAGLVPARVFVDDETYPAAALASIGRRFMLAGSPNNPAFNAWLRSIFLETARSQLEASGWAGFMVYYAPDTWDQVLRASLDELDATKVARQYYGFKELRKDWREQAPAGFALLPVTRGLIGETRLRNRERLMEEMCSERPSVDAFLESSFGICALRGDEIAGWCLSEYNHADNCEIGIETIEAYRRRGLATAMTCAFVEEALAHGYRHIGWDCFAENRASVATALKAGFAYVLDYPAFLVWIEKSAAV